MKHQIKRSFRVFPPLQRGAGGIWGRDSGFTLAELMVVIAVIAILSAIAIPAFSTWMPQYRLKQAARDLYSIVQQVKMTAVKNNTSTNLVFSTSPDQYQYAISGVTKTVVLSDYGSGVKFEEKSGSGTFNTTILTIDPRGFFAPPSGFTDTGFRAYLSNNGNTDYYQVYLATTGALSLLKHSGSTYN